MGSVIAVAVGPERSKGVAISFAAMASGVSSAMGIPPTQPLCWVSSHGVPRRCWTLANTAIASAARRTGAGASGEIGHAANSVTPVGKELVCQRLQGLGRRRRDAPGGCSSLEPVDGEGGGRSAWISFERGDVDLQHRDARVVPEDLAQCLVD